MRANDQRDLPAERASAKECFARHDKDATVRRRVNGQHHRGDPVLHRAPFLWAWKGLTNFPPDGLTQAIARSSRPPGALVYLFVPPVPMLADNGEEQGSSQQQLVSVQRRRKLGARLVACPSPVWGKAVQAAVRRRPPFQHVGGIHWVLIGACVRISGGGGGSRQRVAARRTCNAIPR